MISGKPCDLGVEGVAEICWLLVRKEEELSMGAKGLRQLLLLLSSTLLFRDRSCGGIFN
jgi:hypothetical protein